MTEIRLDYNRDGITDAAAFIAELSAVGIETKTTVSGGQIIISVSN
jgi:hypothetical protein